MTIRQHLYYSFRRVTRRQHSSSRAVKIYLLLTCLFHSPPSSPDIQAPPPCSELVQHTYTTITPNRTITCHASCTNPRGTLISNRTTKVPPNISFSLFVFLFRCVFHPLLLPLSSCVCCIPPLIGLPSLRFYPVASSLFLLSV